MTHKDADSSRDKLRQDLEAKQQNILWPNALMNARRVDQFLWKGSPSPTGVQRVGFAIFGLFYLAVAAFFIIASTHSGILLGLPVGILLAGFGVRITSNAFRGNRTKP